MALNYSRQREAIKEFLSMRKDHPTAEVVYDNVRKIFPNISQGTVYRNLNLLADMGEIKRLRTKDSKDHFDMDISTHYHFVCDHCYQVSDIFVDLSNELDDAANGKVNGKITDREVFYYGICEKCLKETKEML